MKEKPAKKSRKCTIEWSASPPENWMLCFESVQKSSLLQSFSYLQAMAKTNNQCIRYGAIEINGVQAGLCAILEAGLIKNAVHAVMLDQGPLWFEGFGNEDDFARFVAEFRRRFPKRFGRRTRFIPLIEHSPIVEDILTENGFKPQSAPYKTIWMDTRLPIEILRKNLHKRWRNALNKAEKRNLDIVWSAGGTNLGWLVENYIEDKNRRNYAGTSLKTLMALISEFSRGQNLLIGTAVLDGAPIASILIFIHGTSATYQIGYTNDAGRENCAHHLLLWNAVQRLKEGHIHDFDLGGINDEDAKGVRDFKIGMGGNLFEGPGLWV
ncbi:MAG: GNAT family N-acetyltransferase [Alphaproteobacteria bacterium]